MAISSVSSLRSQGLGQVLAQLQQQIQALSRATAQSAPTPSSPTPLQRFQQGYYGDSFTPSGAGVASGGGALDPSRVPYISQLSPQGASGGYSNGGMNCGPACMAMLARAFGYGQGMSDAELVNHFNQMDGTSTGGTTTDAMAMMARAMGKTLTEHLGSDLSFTDRELAAGRPVVALGNPGSGNHYVLITGKDANGNYIVKDPANPSRTTMTATELQSFINAAQGGRQMSIG